MISRCKGISLIETLVALLLLSLGAILVASLCMFMQAWQRHADWQLTSAMVAFRIAESHQCQGNGDLQQCRDALNIQFVGSKIEEVCSQTQCLYTIVPPKTVNVQKLQFILVH